MRRQCRGHDLGGLLRIVALVLGAEIVKARIFLQFLFEALGARVLRRRAGRLGDHHNLALAAQKRIHGVCRELAALFVVGDDLSLDEGWVAIV